MGLAALPSELLRDILFRAARGATSDRVAEILSVCKLFRCEIKTCSLIHATHARPDADQPLKLQDCAALNSLVEGRGTSLITDNFLLSSSAVAVQALTSLPLYCRHWSFLRSECEGLVELPESIVQLTALHTVNLSNYDRLEEWPDSIGHLIAQEILKISTCDGLVGLPDSMGHLTSLQTPNLSNCSGGLELPDSIRHLTALQTLDLNGWNLLVRLPLKGGPTAMSTYMPWNGWICHGVLALKRCQTATGSSPLRIDQLCIIVVASKGYGTASSSYPNGANWLPYFYSTALATTDRRENASAWVKWPSLNGCKTAWPIYIASVFENKYNIFWILWSGNYFFTIDHEN